MDWGKAFEERDIATLAEGVCKGRDGSDSVERGAQGRESADERPHRLRHEGVVKLRLSAKLDRRFDRITTGGARLGRLDPQI